MRLIVSNTNETPIYQQIKDQIKEEILRGSLKEGNQLPSIRVLANETGVSVLTSKRAYDELEQEGYIHGVQGKGFYVAGQNLNLLKEEKMKEIEDKLKEAMEIASMVGVTSEEIKMMLDLLIEER